VVKNKLKAWSVLLCTLSTMNMHHHSSQNLLWTFLAVPHRVIYCSFKCKIFEGLNWETLSHSKILFLSAKLAEEHIVPKSACNFPSLFLGFTKENGMGHKVTATIRIGQKRVRWTLFSSYFCNIRFIFLDGLHLSKIKTYACSLLWQSFVMLWFNMTRSTAVPVWSISRWIHRFHEYLCVFFCAFCLP